MTRFSGLCTQCTCRAVVVDNTTCTLCLSGPVTCRFWDSLLNFALLHTYTSFNNIINTRILTRVHTACSCSIHYRERVLKHISIDDTYPNTNPMIVRLITWLYAGSSIVSDYAVQMKNVPACCYWTVTKKHCDSFDCENVFISHYWMSQLQNVISRED